MAPLDQYLIPDEKAEIALARSSAPAPISDAADVLVLRRDGYATAVMASSASSSGPGRQVATASVRCRSQYQARSSRAFNTSFARSDLPDLLDEHSFKSGQHLSGRPARQLFEIMDHVHLIVIAKIMSDLRPGLPPVEGLGCESRLKSHDAREQLWPDAQLFDKPSGEMTLA